MLFLAISFLPFYLEIYTGYNLTHMVLKAPIHPLCIKAYIYKRLISGKSIAKHYKVVTFISLTSFIWFVLKKERTKERTKTKI